MKLFKTAHYFEKQIHICKRNWLVIDAHYQPSIKLSLGIEVMPMEKGRRYRLGIDLLGIGIMYRHNLGMY